MRAACLGLLAVCLLGCGKIDSSRSTSGVDVSPPANPRSNEPARPAGAPNEAAPSAANPAAQPDNTTQPDNTAVNARDANRTAREPKLPIDQKETRTDVDLTAKIRSRVVNTEGLSVDARNAKIITADGHVTLRGPVESQAERDTIVRIARELAGDTNVDDQLEIKKSGASSANP